MRSKLVCDEMLKVIKIRQVALKYFLENYPEDIQTKALASGFSYPSPCCSDSEKKYDGYQLLCEKHWDDPEWIQFINLYHKEFPVI